MADVLATQRTTTPGVYIGNLHRPTPSSTTGFRRLPCIVGKGSRLQTVFNSSIRRSFLQDVSIPFPNTSPHVSPLVEPALNDQSIAVLNDSDGRIVPISKWRFIESTPGSGIFDQVLLSPDTFSLSSSYTLSYQSTSPDLRDELPFDNLREMRLVGDAESQHLYEEFTHYYIPITITSPLPSADNALSEETDVGFEPAQVHGSSEPYIFAGGETLLFDVDATSYTATFALGDTTAALVAPAINTALGDDGTAFANPDGSFTIASNSEDPSTSAVAVTGGLAAPILGLSGAQFPSAPMVGAGFGTAGYLAPATGVVSTIAMGFSSASSSPHAYHRKFTVTLGAPAAGNIPATIVVEMDSGSSLPEVSSGASMPAAQIVGPTAEGTQPQLPFHSSLSSAGLGTSVEFTAGQNAVTTVTFTDITGDVITLILDDDAGTVAGGEVFTGSSLGPSAIELHSALARTEQHDSFSSVSTGAMARAGAPAFSVGLTDAPTGTGSAALRSDAVFRGRSNRRYLLVCTNSTGFVVR